MKLQPLSQHLGADVVGIDLRDVDDAAFEAIHQAWLRYSVLRFRDQTLSDDDLKAFSERFGPLEFRPMGKVTEAERERMPNPYVTVISNIVEEGKPIGGLGALESKWHTDMSYVETPPTASALYAVEVPPTGGDTQFCSMRSALGRLPSELRRAADEHALKHDAAHDSVGRLRRGFDHAGDPAGAPGAVHPMVMTHPETGERVLYLGRRADAYVEGLPLAESERLLDAIWAHVAKPEDMWTQEWRVGDLVVWDNRALMHRRDAFDPTTRRLMRRTQVRPRAVAG